jgi:hypothetical protein
MLVGAYGIPTRVFHRDLVVLLGKIDAVAPPDGLLFDSHGAWLASVVVEGMESDRPTARCCWYRRVRCGANLLSRVLV